MERNFFGFPTGSHENIEQTKIVEREFYPYTIKVKLGDYNQFIEITEVKLSKSFIGNRSSQILSSTHDIEEFYK